MTIAVYPGTFDPMTLGHLDIVRRASTLFQTVLVAVAASEKKRPIFTLDERIALARNTCRSMENVQVVGFSGLLADFCREQGAAVIVRSARSAADYEYEVPMSLMNRRLGGVETVFLTPTPNVQHISGTLVREIAALGGNVSDCVTPQVALALKMKLADKD